MTRKTCNVIQLEAMTQTDNIGPVNRFSDFEKALHKLNNGEDIDDFTAELEHI